MRIAPSLLSTSMTTESSDATGPQPSLSLKQLSPSQHAFALGDNIITRSSLDVDHNDKRSIVPFRLLRDLESKMQGRIYF
jgi:hypothetical protein